MAAMPPSAAAAGLFALAAPWNAIGDVEAGVTVGPYETDTELAAVLGTSGWPSGASETGTTGVEAVEIGEGEVSAGGVMVE